MTDDGTIHGLATAVYAEILGDQLAAAASVGATVLTVYDVAHFEPGPGFVRINSVIYPYTECDDDANTVTLGTPLTAAAGVNDRVDLYDQANSRAAFEYTAIVGQLDGFDDPAPIGAILPDNLYHALQQEMVDGNGVSVVLERDAGALEVTKILGRASSLASLQFMQGGFTTRTADDQSGIEILGTSGTPGIHVYGPNGVEQMAMTADTAGGVVKAWTGFASETGPAYWNPAIVGGGPVLQIGSPVISGASRAVLNMTPGNPTPVASFPGTEVFANNIVTGFNIEAGGDCIADGSLWSVTHDTTTLAASVRFGPGGKLVEVTSLSGHKLDQQPLSVEAVRGVLRLTPKTWFDRAEVEENGGTEGLRRVPGLVAEDVEEHVPELASYDGDGELQGVHYDRVAAYLIPIVREQQERIDRLERLVTHLLETKES